MSEGFSSKHALTNQLVQLQELVMVKAERRSTKPNSRFADLDAAIQEALVALPEGAQTQFRRHAQRGELAIVPIAIHDGEYSCSACNMNISCGTANEIRTSTELASCESCSRVMYYPEDSPRGLKRKADGETAGIARFSAPELMIADLKATTGEEAIKEICAKLKKEGFVDNAKRLTQVMVQREEVMSTAVEYGIAFPHARGIEGGGLTVALGVSRKGIAFGGPGGSLSRLFFVLVIPTATSVFYLKLLAGLTQALNDKKARASLQKAEDDTGLWDALLEVADGHVQ